MRKIQVGGQKAKSVREGGTSLMLPLTALLFLTIGDLRPIYFSKKAV